MFSAADTLYINYESPSPSLPRSLLPSLSHTHTGRDPQMAGLGALKRLLNTPTPQRFRLSGNASQNSRENESGWSVLFTASPPPSVPSSVRKLIFTWGAWAFFNRAQDTDGKAEVPLLPLANWDVSHGTRRLGFARGGPPSACCIMHEDARTRTHTRAGGRAHAHTHSCTAVERLPQTRSDQIAFLGQTTAARPWQFRPCREQGGLRATA